MKEHVEINFYGEIKGLGLMQFVQTEARSLGLTGYIKRLPTGTLHIEAEGERGSLEKFVEACQTHEDWTERNDFSFSPGVIGYDRFYIRKFG